MKLTTLARACVASSVTLLGAVTAHAADFTFSGNIFYNTDVVPVSFGLASDATNVKVWTDSFQGGVNFDPITALWQRVGSDYQLVSQNDDNASVAPGQTTYDSGFVVPSLAAGDYLFTVAAYNNFAFGSLLSEGFSFANNGTAQVPIASWNQPAGIGDQHGSSGASTCRASTPQPVPAPWCPRSRNRRPMR